MDCSRPWHRRRPRGIGSWSTPSRTWFFVDPVQMIPVRGRSNHGGEKWERSWCFPTAGTPLSVRWSRPIRTRSGEGGFGVARRGLSPGIRTGGFPEPRVHLRLLSIHPRSGGNGRAYCRLSRFSWSGGLARSMIQPRSGSSSISTTAQLAQRRRTLLRERWIPVCVDRRRRRDERCLRFRAEAGPRALLRNPPPRCGPGSSRSHPIRRQPADDGARPPGWPASFTQGYFIPNDNPWPSPDGRQLEEFFWAIGARSPHRMTMDRPTGRVWIGDVGQSAEEEINVVSRGDNLQWPFREGKRRERKKGRRHSRNGTPPLLRYGRGEGGCVIGGYVYRGGEHPELAGKYLFGDFNNGQIRTLDDSGETPSSRRSRNSATSSSPDSGSTRETSCICSPSDRRT